MKYLRPSKIKQLYPQIQWTPQQIGWLHRLGLVDGIRTSRETLIAPEDVYLLWKLKQKLQEKGIVNTLKALEEKK